MATSLYPFTTTWTGAGDGTNWSDPANWSNGVPLPSAPATDASQDIATIDNSVDTAPFGLVIAGSQSAGEIDLNVTDPASGPAVSLTGTLNMSTNVQPTGSGFGHINLTSGTFEIDGGTLEGAEVTEKGGTLTFGGASPITLGGDIIDGNVAIDNGVTVVMAASNGAVFDGVGGYGTATDVTISGGATLSTVGSISAAKSMCRLAAPCRSMAARCTAGAAAARSLPTAARLMSRTASPSVPITFSRAR